MSLFLKQRSIKRKDSNVLSYVLSVFFSQCGEISLELTVIWNGKNVYRCDCYVQRNVIELRKIDANCIWVRSYKTLQTSHQITTHVCTVSSLCQGDAGDVYTGTACTHDVRLYIAVLESTQLLADTSCQHSRVSDAVAAANECLRLIKQFNKIDRGLAEIS